MLSWLMTGLALPQVCPQQDGAVRRNWLALYPQSARLGVRGQAVLKFNVAKDGKITKMILETKSGVPALDRAAIAAVAASNPLPALPAEFHGERIVLALTFTYNAAR